MDWKIAAAKQNFSQVVRKATQEPQKIYNRDQLAAMVIAGPVLQEFLDWKRLRTEPPEPPHNVRAAEVSEVREASHLPYDAGYLRIRRNAYGHLPIPETIFQKAGLNPEVEMQILARDGALEITPAPRTVHLKRRGKLLIAFPVHSGDSRPQDTLTRDTVQATLNSIRRRDHV